MHIPDGFISPQTYVPVYAATAGLWAYGIKKLKSQLSEKTLPFVAVMTAFSFILSSIMVPIPGGSSGHMIGVGILSIAFGYWTAFVSLSMVFLLQALFFGEGGITTFGINAFAMGFAGSVTAYYTYTALKKVNENLALFLSGWTAVVVSSLITAFILGIQPAVAQDSSGKPLFFPFGIEVTLPAVVIPHLFIGIGEGLITLAGIKVYRRIKNGR
ncbi:energy-coupling factor ABC transporter permease [Persephonella sp.]